MNSINNVMILREAYCILSRTRHDPTLRPVAPIPERGYYFSPLGVEDLRAELSIGLPQPGTGGTLSRLRIFQPGFGPGSWPGNVLAICDVVDGPGCSDSIHADFYVGDDDKAREDLCRRLKETLSLACAQARATVAKLCQ